VSEQKPIELTLEDDPPLPRGKPRLAGNAYDPYDVEGGHAPTKDADKAAANRTDLRKLSQWIKLKREVDELNGVGSEPAPLRKKK
jgi:hypothetical protein